MAECYDFFDDSASGKPGRSIPLLSEELRSGGPDTGKEDLGSKGLELTLGPSNFMGTSASPTGQQQDTVRPSPPFRFLQEQSSGNVLASLVSAASMPQGPCLQSEGSRVCSLQEDKTVGLSRQRDADRARAKDDRAHAEEDSLSSLGNPPNSAHFSAKILLPAGDNRFPSRDQIWQALEKGKTAPVPTLLENDASTLWNRRAMSLHAAFPSTVAKDLDHFQIRRSSSNGGLAHARLQRHSSVDLFLNNSLKQNVTFSQRHPPKEAEDVQKRKEMQAQRRMQARKRRRSATGEKQHKKGKPLQAINVPFRIPESRICEDEEFSAGEEDAAPESGCICPDNAVSCRSDHLEKSMCDLQQWASKIDIQASPIEDIEHPLQDIQLDGAAVSASIYGHGKRGGPSSLRFNRSDSGTCNSMLSSELEHAGITTKCSSMSRLPISSKEHESLEFFKSNDHVRMRGPESEETRIFLSNRAGCSEINGLVDDAAKEGARMVRSMSSSLSSAPVGCSSHRPRKEIMQFARAAADAAPSVDSFKANVPFPCIGTLPPPPATILSRTISAVGDSEGKRVGNTFLPLSKTFSNTKTGFEERQNAGAQLDYQLSLPVSHLSSTSTGVSKTSNGKNLLVERQCGQPLGPRLLSQNSCIVDQALSCSRPGQRGMPMAIEPLSLKARDSNLKQEEASCESQLASEHSMDASHSRLTDGERQKDGALVNLHWVTTTGNGPNGKTINGFMYIANGRHVRLVCCCHGKHMSPAEFVQHSGSTDLSNPERNIVVSPLPSFSRQAASTPV